MTNVVYGATRSGTRIYPHCLNWLLRAHSPRRETVLSLDIVGKTLVLPQRDMLDFIKYPWEALPSLKDGVREKWREQKKERE